MKDLTRGDAKLSKFIDHTLLKPDSLQKDFEKLCQEAIAHQFFSVCIPPARVPLAAKLLKHSSVKVCTVIGFPLGYTSQTIKGYETRMAVEQGADEIDMVLNISALKSGDKNTVFEDIRSVVQNASGHLVKVILETCYLTDDEKKLACHLSMDAGAQFVKTSTGFGPSGATETDVILMASIVKPKLSVKASGGIRDYKTAMKMIELGASRLGTSNGIAIVTQAEQNSEGTY
jgi:deoxyribose-phosphate aldolase